MTWMQVEAYLAEDDRCVIPLGSTEQHAYLSLATDCTLAERVSIEAAESLGVPVFPVLPYGITPYFMAFPGTVSLSPNAYERVLGEVLGSVRRHGFRRIVLVNGHGGNTQAKPVAMAWADGHEGVEVRWHDWWSAPATRAAVDAIDPTSSHASWMEGFPWTRVPGVTVPAGRKPPVDVGDREALSVARFRDKVGDGSFGGYYERSEDEMLGIWAIAVAETRARIEEGW
jgi:creatinine amidohydrolase